MDKIKIPTKESRRLDSLESENAELWFENLVQQGKSTVHEQELADLWFAQMTGGMM